MKKLSQAKPQRANANRHTQRGMGLLESSIQSDGWIGAITVAADGETFDGSARLEVGAATGFEDAIVVDSDGTKPVIVRRHDIPTADDPRAVRLGIAANRVAQLNLDWSPDLLAELREQDGILEGLFRDDELETLLGNLQDPGDLWKGMPEFEQEDVEGFFIHVHCVTEADQTRLLKQLGLAYTKKTNSASVWYPEKPEGNKDQLAAKYRYSSEP